MVEPYQSYHKRLHQNDVPSTPTRLLVAVDGSVESLKAARYAIMLAKISKAQVICLHSITNLPYVDYENLATMQGEYINTAKRHAKSWIGQITAEAAEHKVNVIGETIITDSSVTEFIVNYANDKKVDIILMGTKGRTGLKKVLLGSVATGVVTHAGCPVLVVR